MAGTLVIRFYVESQWSCLFPSACVCPCVNAYLCVCVCACVLAYISVWIGCLCESAVCERGCEGIASARVCRWICRRLCMYKHQCAVVDASVGAHIRAGVGVCVHQAAGSKSAGHSSVLKSWLKSCLLTLYADRLQSHSTDCFFLLIHHQHLPVPTSLLLLHFTFTALFQHQFKPCIILILWPICSFYLLSKTVSRLIWLKVFSIAELPWLALFDVYLATFQTPPSVKWNVSFLHLLLLKGTF